MDADYRLFCDISLPSYLLVKEFPSHSWKIDENLLFSSYSEQKVLIVSNERKKWVCLCCDLCHISAN